MAKEITRVLANVSDIMVEDGFNPRKNITKESVERMSRSMDAHGQLQPIGVIELSEEDENAPKKYKLRFGERRFRAAQLLEWEQVEIKVLKGTDDAMRIKSLVENIEREDMTALDEAEAISQYMEQHNTSQADMARVLNKSGPWVSQRLKILHNGTEKLKEAIETGAISSSLARELAGLPPEEQDDKLQSFLEKTEAGEKPTAEGLRLQIELEKRAREEAESGDDGSDDDGDEDDAGGPAEVGTEGKGKPKKKKPGKSDDPKQKERLSAVKDFYDEDDLARVSVRKKAEVLAMLAVLHTRKGRAKSDRVAIDTKAQIVAIEYMAGLRDSI